MALLQKGDRVFYKDAPDLRTTESNHSFIVDDDEDEDERVRIYVWCHHTYENVFWYVTGNYIEEHAHDPEPLLPSVMVIRDGAMLFKHPGSKSWRKGNDDEIEQYKESFLMAGLNAIFEKEVLE